MQRRVVTSYGKSRCPCGARSIFCCTLNGICDLTRMFRELRYSRSGGGRGGICGQATHKEYQGSAFFDINGRTEARADRRFSSRGILIMMPQCIPHRENKTITTFCRRALHHIRTCIKSHGTERKKEEERKRKAQREGTDV